MAGITLTDAQKWILGGLAAIAVLLGLALVIASALDDDDTVVPRTTTTTQASTTTATSSPTTTTFVSDVDAFGVAYPSPLDSRRFDDPAPAARGFALDVLGFTDLVQGEVRYQTGSWAIIDVQDRSDGPVTEIEVRRKEDRTWYAVTAEAANITVSVPAVGASLATPFETAGTALAFEGTVDVVVLDQSGLQMRGSGFVTGSGIPPAGPFDGRIFFSPPDDSVPGVLVYRSLSPEDGRVVEATAFPIRITDARLSTPPERCGDTADGAADEGGARVVKVYFHCGVDDEPIALRRTIPDGDPAILTRTIERLLSGPTGAEQEAGFTSPFPIEGGRLLGVSINEGRATIDLSDEHEGIPNGSAAILAVRAELFRTATQFSSVSSIEVWFGGSCDRFAEWSQTGTCVITET